MSQSPKADERKLKFNLQKGSSQSAYNSVESGEDEDVMVVLATAHPDKFSNVIVENAAIPYTRTHHFPYSEERCQHFPREGNWRDLLLSMLDQAN